MSLMGKDCNSERFLTCINSLSSSKFENEETTNEHNKEIIVEYMCHPVFMILS